MNTKTLSFQKFIFVFFYILFLAATLSIVWPGKAPAAELLNCKIDRDSAEKT